MQSVVLERNVLMTSNFEFSITYWERQRRRAWMCALFFGTAALYSSRLILPVNNYHLSKEFKWNQRISGLVLGSFFYGYMMTQYFGGLLGDRMGGEKVLTYAAFIWSLMTLIFPFVPELFENRNFILVGFIVCRVLLGAFQGFHFPSISSLMAVRVSLVERQFTYCVMHSGSHVGTLFCGLVGGYVMEHYGWRVSFYFIGFTGLLWAVVVSYFLLESDSDIESMSQVSKIELKLDEDKENNIEIDDEISTRTSKQLPLMQLVTNIAFWAMLFAHFTNNNLIFIILNWVPTYFHDNYPNAKSWVFNVVPYLINIPSTLFSGLLADNLIRQGHTITFVRKLMTAITLLGGGLALLIISTVSNYYASLFWVAVAVTANGFHSSGILLNPQDLGPKHGGSIYGIMSMIGAIPGFAGIYLVGFILDKTKSWPMVFQLTGGFSIFGWLIYQLFGTGNQIV